MAQLQKKSRRRSSNATAREQRHGRGSGALVMYEVVRLGGIEYYMVGMVYVLLKYLAYFRVNVFRGAGARYSTIGMPYVLL